MKYSSLLISACGLLLISCQNNTHPPAPQIPLRPIEPRNVSFKGAYLNATKADKPPRELEGPIAAYPYELRAAGGQGKVLLAIAIDAKGSVKEVKVGAATDERFAKRAQDALFQWKFSPAIKDGKAVPCYFLKPVYFLLKDKR